jgi:hypothetical protein
MSRRRDDEVVHRRLDTDRDDPVVQVAEVVAELDGRPTAELTPGYERLDAVLTDVFVESSGTAARTRVTFTYEGYRVTVGQDGTVQLVDD